jgi:hypothetical protein
MREQVSSVAIVDDSGVIIANLSVSDLKVRISHFDKLTF